MLTKQDIYQDDSSLIVALRCFDMLLVMGTAVLAHFLRFGHAPVSLLYALPICIAGIFVLIIFSLSRVYLIQYGINTLKHFSRLIGAFLMVMALLSFIALFGKITVLYSRVWFATWIMLAVPGLFLSHFIFFNVLHSLHEHGWNLRAIAIVGDKQLAHYLVNKLQSQTWLGFKPVVIFSEGEPQAQTRSGVPVIALPEKFVDYLNENNIREVWFAGAMENNEAFTQLVQRLRQQVVSVRLIIDTLHLNLLHQPVKNMLGLPTVTVTAGALQTIERLMKSGFDRVFSFLVLIVISPLLLVIALAIKLTSKGPVLFKQSRHGFDGQSFTIYKFRTMFVNSDDEQQATREDVRITPLGRFLRQTSLDELPQFFNVLQGTMSVVGPRPHTLAHNEQFKALIDRYMSRHIFRPGITGWAQVNGFRGETDTLEKMQQRLEYDHYYMNNWSLWFDLKIICFTLVTGFIHRNAY